MPRIALTLAVVLTLAVAAWPQSRDRDKTPRLPNGKSQRIAILKENHRKSLADVAEIRQLARELEEELSANTEYVLSLDALKKTERIEDLAAAIRKRMKQGN